MAAYGLYSHIQSNRRRSLALLVGLFFLVYVLVYAGALIAEALSVDADLNTLMLRAWSDLINAAPWATVGTALWVVVAYFFHQSMIDAVTGGREVTRAEQPRLYNLLENLCISRGITMPKLKVMDSDALNAFATGLSDKQYSITITSGLLNRLNDAEVESVLGHELTHIRNGDVRMMVIAVIIAGVVSFVAELAFRLWFYNGLSFRGSRSDNRRGGGAGVAILIGIGLLVLAYILSFIIRLALSRSRELLADAGSVELTADDLAEVTRSEVLKFSAGGFRDFTRIAASDPTMWRDVFLANKDAVLEMLGTFNEDLSQITRAIRRGDGEALFAHFTRTRAIRRGIVQIGQDSPAADFGRPHPDLPVEPLPRPYAVSDDS